MRIITVVGARPQFIKAAAVSLAIQKHNSVHPQNAIEEKIIHTGQHYDDNMSEIFFEQLEIPRPWSNLNVGSGSHGRQTADMMIRLEQLLVELDPDAVLTYGDTNSTLASALVAAKLNIPVAHVEAGLRSFNREMPEEINRILTDHVSTWLFGPTTTAVNHLANEGITTNVFLTGDVMYDAARFFGHLSDQQSNIIAKLSLTKGGFYLATVHRAENTDSKNKLTSIFAALEAIGSADMPVVLPLHPRTQKQLQRFKMSDRIDESSAMMAITPVNFLDMVALEKNAKLILTDSGGVQKEAYFHGVPCVTLRMETEWTELVKSKWNTLAGTEKTTIENCVRNTLDVFAEASLPRPDFYGDGHASQKIVKHLLHAQQDKRCKASRCY